jgi:protein-L-isoaspartate(D-aspartate) O-methyltransferase
MTTSPSVLSRRLYDDLADRGQVTRQWAAALHAVPRHAFVPETIYRHERGRGGNDLVPVRRAEQPDEWLNLVYADQPVNTQVNNGRPEPDGTGREVTSSSSQPTVVAQMLDELSPRPGERILEIGSGTGWNAAVLAYLVGAENVTTVEIDPAVAAHARAALDTNGYGEVTTIVGDGGAGWPPGAPYGRVIATVGVAAIPYAWVAQTAPDGRIVAPLTGSYQPPGIVALVRHGDGTASGRLAGPAAFMPLRAQHVPRITSGHYPGPAERTSTTYLHPHRYAGDRAAMTAIGLRVTGVVRVWQPAGTLGVLWLYAPETRSWATVELLDQPPYPVEQAGPRQLFDEVAAAYQWWCDTGRPDVGDWLVTVTPEGQRIERG